jgi:cytochrome c-type biogenesis protein CcmH/NrfG
MEDESPGLRELLRELPRERASEGFTARVVARLSLSERRPEPRPFPRPRFAMATAALVVALGSAGLLRQQGLEREALRQAEARRTLREIRSEHERLTRQLHEMSGTGVVYVGGNEDVDLVVDLSRVQTD